MIGSFKKLAAIALSLGLSTLAGRAHASAVTFGGWDISSDPGISLSISGVNGSQVLVIENKSVTFSNGIPLGVTFTQASPGAVSSVEFATETIGNATGSDWTGFQFSLTGAATFDGIANVFAPPFGTGVNYSSVQLNAMRNLLSYTGSQSDGATSSWGSSNPGDDLLIDAVPTTGEPFASFTLTESPQGVSSKVVPLPAAAWQSLPVLLLLAVIPAARKTLSKTRA
jgi:hypothetical protein